MRRLIFILTVLILLATPAFAVRWSIGASTGTRIDIGASQGGEPTGGGTINLWWWRRRHSLHHDRLDLQILDLHPAERVVA